ncbi:MAG: hypothetical protein NZ521_09380, partial [Flammeovirgaceae bacterium]|nr:hypothetical protein [Flammeovirgaceae bacterium]MDW8288331.1 hypothetical protein [Flammeovirgaceae bacterium]
MKSYVLIMLSLGSISTILLAYSFMENMKQSDENTMYYGLVTSMVFLFWIAIVFAPYRAGQALKNVENRFLHEVGWQWQEKVLAVYFKILALSLTILLINIAVLILFLALSFFGIVYSVVVLIGALILIIGTLGFILLADNFAPFQHLEKIWSFIELPTRFFEFEKTILTSLHIEPVWLIPIGFVLFLIIPNLIA